jgi:hypothetical protein
MIHFKFNNLILNFLIMLIHTSFNLTCQIILIFQNMLLDHKYLQCLIKEIKSQIKEYKAIKPIV